MNVKHRTIVNAMSQFTHKIIFVFLLVGVTLSFTAPDVFANNLTFSDFEVYSVNTTSDTITYTCDISWENSWRSSDNYLVVWVFMKYSVDGGTTWLHATMGGNGLNPTGFYSNSNFEIVVPSDETGFFLQRVDYGSGTAEANKIRFVWDYGQDGLMDSTAIAANTINKVFGIEMVYIPEGAFYAGDGNSSSDYRFKQGSSDNDPWYVQSESAITTTSGAADGYYYQNTGASGENSSGAVFLIPSSYPKGYQAFYIMKYELTEGQWVSFFNTLSPQEKANRDITSSTEGGKNSDSVVDRNTIAWDASDAASEATTLREDRPISYVSWPDILAYADWAAVRPVTELEYEKAARGKDISVVNDEFVWGKTSYNSAESSEIYPDSDEDGTEQIFDGAANLNRNNLAWSSGDGRVGGIAQGQKGPLRVGIFAESSTNRVTSGAGYYGNLELSGNLSEMIITLGKNEGRQYLGTHGDGQLSTVSGFEGNATNTDWPGLSGVNAGRGVTGTAGSGYRGGNFQSSNLRYYQTSTRAYAVKDPDSEGFEQRYDSSFGIFGGGRLGRTAP